MTNEHREQLDALIARVAELEAALELLKEFRNHEAGVNGRGTKEHVVTRLEILGRLYAAVDALNRENTDA